ncbi:Piso0_000463 [Millerozyma farinosa CBS 7064]|uniref:Piso0_000463 protein n=1 Tax=Pichia sorbitophila (strain ATCC MYA-4447 / BCRC 22081 / CBS 7064 / NBRC 10061 / NRRL Y-12695) TaxID=559304 RepID=G8YU22_PICSO|nr:Piso0_000463 [Millerozyma farinosa CBS 7064]CCE73423.1 Piso0_000463 [Millerozyma farinosa CBS 7064]
MCTEASKRYYVSSSGTVAYSRRLSSDATRLYTAAFGFEMFDNYTDDLVYLRCFLSDCLARCFYLERTACDTHDLFLPIITRISCLASLPIYNLEIS